jgi:hypothetical protein
LARAVELLQPVDLASQGGNQEVQAGFHG